MVPQTFRRLCYAWLLAQGVLATLVPRIALRLNLKPAALAFENVGELDPREWYLRWTRAAGIGMLAAGAAGLVLESAADREEGAPGEPIDLEEPDSGEDGSVEDGVATGADD